MLFFLRFCCQLKTNPELNVEFVYGFLYERIANCNWLSQ